MSWVDRLLNKNDPNTAKPQQATNVIPVITVPTAHRSINADGLRLVKAFEGCSLTAYLDNSTPPCPTIGWGEIFHSDGSRVQMGETITQQEADAMLMSALYTEASHFIDAWTTQVLSDNRYSALISFVYNAGCGTYRRKVLPYINSGNFDGAITAMKNCNSAGGGPLPGLIRRRVAECALFVGDIAAMNKAINA